MKHQLILASVATFATAANKLLQANDQPMLLADASLSADGKIGAMFTQDSTRPRHASGSIVHIEVMDGDLAVIEGKLQEKTMENPYVAPIKILVSSSAVEPAPGSKAKAAKPRVVLIVGTYQP